INLPTGAQIDRTNIYASRALPISHYPTKFLLMCRFSDAGGDEPSTRSGGRRLKSAEARNRGEVGHRRCRGLYGDLAAALGWGGWIKAPAPIGLPSQDGCGGRLERAPRR